MKTKELISAVINSQSQKLASGDIGLEREILNEIQVIDSYALIIAGIRRCGKSTLVLQLHTKLKNAIYLNFEDIRLVGFEGNDFDRLSTLITESETEYLFFDEIQLIPSWEIFIHQKLNEGYKVVITGSNASMLSKELGTHLTGRHISIELFPFSFNEFIQYKNLEANNESLNEYLAIGGIPEHIKSNQGIILRQLIDDILARDIAQRHGIRDIRPLRELTVFLISNIGKPVSARSLENLFGIKAASTILEYFSFLQDAYIVCFIPVFDYSLKIQIRNPKKVYAIDTGIFNQAKTTFTPDLGRQLENAIFLKLRRKYKEIYYFNKEGECDFIVIERGKCISCLQICYELNDLNLDRELNGLINALSFFKLKQGKIITYNQTDKFEKDGYTIIVQAASSFLMD